MASMVFSISLPPDLGATLEKMAADKGVTVSRFIQDLIVEKGKEG